MLNFNKRKWMISKCEEGMSISDICKAQGVSRQTFYNLKEDYSKKGIEALRDKFVGRRLDSIPPKIQDKIIAKRKEGNGIRRIEGLLKQEGIKISDREIRRTLIEKDLHIFEPKKGKRYKYIRWQRNHSNSLWQTDFCWIEKLGCWLTAWLDDHSRLITAADYITEATTESSLNLFERGAKKWGLPRETLSDRGAQYYSGPGEACRFLEHMQFKGVKHIYASVKKPTTCGKMERWWGTHNTERWKFDTLLQFVNHYNYKRPHMSLGYKTPYEVWKKDLKV